MAEAGMDWRRYGHGCRTAIRLGKQACLTTRTRTGATGTILQVKAGPMCPRHPCDLHAWGSMAFQTGILPPEYA